MNARVIPLILFVIDFPWVARSRDLLASIAIALSVAPSNRWLAAINACHQLQVIAASGRDGCRSGLLLAQKGAVRGKGSRQEKLQRKRGGPHSTPTVSSSLLYNNNIVTYPRSVFDLGAGVFASRLLLYALRKTSSLLRSRAEAL